MTLGEAMGYIDQAAELPSVEWISFTGGEPFLLPDTLLSLVEYASGKGLETEVVTNCFWAESRERAIHELRRLVEVGLDVVNISADDFHQAAIPFEHVRDCFEAAKDVGLKVVIMCSLKKTSELSLARIRELLGDDGIQRAGEQLRGKVSALGIESAFIPVGRGAKLPRDEWLVSHDPVDGACGDVLRDIGISPGGDILICCGAAAQSPAARIGNLNDRSLKEILEDAWERRVFRTLALEGPRGLQHELGLEGDEYVGKCHLCYEMLAHHPQGGS